MCFCERQTITGSSGQGGQDTIHGHMTGRDQRYEVRGVSGDVNYFQTSISSRRTAQETSSTEDVAAAAADSGVG